MLVFQKSVICPRFFSRIMSSDYLSMISCVQLLRPLLKSGVLVCLLSSNGENPQEHQTLYTAASYALRAFLTSLQEEDGMNIQIVDSKNMHCDLSKKRILADGSYDEPPQPLPPLEFPPVPLEEAVGEILKAAAHAKLAKTSIGK